jgi:hypothetical protein
MSAAIRRHGGRPRPLLKAGTADMNLPAIDNVLSI